jgi:hypothetical protein
MFAGEVNVIFLALTAVGRADTINHADAVSALAKDCGYDIKKLRSGPNLGNGRIQQCLEKNIEGLAGLHVDAFDGQDVDRHAPAQAPVFKHEVSQNCNGVKRDGNIIFLVSPKPSASTTKNATRQSSTRDDVNDDRTKGSKCSFATFTSF